MLNALIIFPHFLVNLKKSLWELLLKIDALSDERRSVLLAFMGKVDLVFQYELFVMHLEKVLICLLTTIWNLFWEWLLL